ncbi:glycosyltransferase [Fibrivirga algicola]|nr:glycosyltransferase [Fibrivirga algicola]
MLSLPSEAEARVAASVTLYNSLPSCVDAIASYQNQVEQVYLIDNSEFPDTILISELTKWPNVQYVCNGGNRGVAAALNIAARLAIDNGFEFLLTMDDDTYLPPNSLQSMVLVAKTNNYKIGLVSGIHSGIEQKISELNVLYTMTSGNILNLQAYKIAGPFREDFFIDHVDHEYGLRLNRLGYKIIQLNSVQLKHNLGKRKSVGWGTFIFISHTPIRGYYMVRNGLVLAKLYPEFRFKAITLITKEWIKSFFFEDDKFNRLRLLYRGVIDAYFEKLGKFKS